MEGKGNFEVPFQYTLFAL